MSQRINNIIEELIDQYLEEDRYNRPWIIGFSGGKDSTVLLTLVWMALSKIRGNNENYTFNRQVYVVCNDTMVENPIIEEYVNTVLHTIKNAAKEQNLPIIVNITTPKLEDTFWCCVIGKGYPVPNNAFRFCTEKMKIKPTSQFIESQVNENGEGIILIGTRLSESQQRARSIQKHEIKGHRLSKHPLNPNTFTYAPIKELQLEEVWYIINTIKSPWGFDNQILFNIYMDASADDYECPSVVTDESHKACGQSRFGCWVCTVVKEDKSMSALIKNGVEWMRPLLDFRNRLVENRNISEYRNSTRRNGQEATDESGHKMGNYTIEYRIELLRDLLIAQKQIQKIKPHIDLIKSQELIAIQVMWYRDGEFSTTVNQLYNEVYGRSFSTESITLYEKIVLEKACNGNPNDYQLIQDLLALQKSKSLLMKHHGLQSDLESHLDLFLKNEHAN